MTQDPLLVLPAFGDSVGEWGVIDIIIVTTYKY